LLVAGRLISGSYRTSSLLTRQRSPEHPSPSPSPSTTPHQGQEGRYSRGRNPQTPRSYRVYNDALSPGTQPQTPAQLPESRHQSRFHFSYTAPITRAAARLGTVSGASRERRVRRTIATPSRARGNRSGSPVGLQSDGFRGLYGGRENGDEEQSWINGVRFSNAEVRLWGVRDGAGDGGHLRNTPEREEWRIGRE
jgi:hypothetical protein